MPDPRADYWVEKLKTSAVARATIVSLRTRGDEIWRRAFKLLQRESPEYRNAVDDEFTEESKAHCSELLAIIVAIAAGDSREIAVADPFGFVRSHARWRAQHHVPLVASLHAYRIAHRIYSEISQESLARHRTAKQVVGAQRVLSEFWIELFDHVGHLLAETYALEDALGVALETSSYARLIDDLLRGIEPRGHELRRIRDLRGIRSGAPLSVAVARPRLLNGHHVDSEVTLRSVVRLLEQTLSATPFGTLLDARDGHVITIACCNANTSDNLVRVLRRTGFSKRLAAAGHFTAVGISTDVTDVEFLPEALKEAQLALEFGSDEQPIVSFRDIQLPDLLVRRADPIAVRLVPAWAHDLLAADDSQSRELIRTIRLFADCNFNVKSTARRIGVHTNTIYFRLNRLKKISGIDPRTYSGATFILTGLRLLEHHVMRPDT